MVFYILLICNALFETYKEKLQKLQPTLTSRKEVNDFYVKQIEKALSSDYPPSLNDFVEQKNITSPRIR